MAKRKRISTAIQGAATTKVPILPPPSKRRASQRRVPQPNPDTGSINPDKNANVLDAPEVLRASPDGDETMNLEEAGMDVGKQAKKDDSEATPQGMSSDADTDPEHSTTPKPNNLPCIFTVEPFQLAGPSQESDSEPTDVYIVRPTAIWNSLERFKVFAMGDQNYSLHDMVTVARHDLPKSPLWTAIILEIRGHKASSQAFIRLYWFYQPSQLSPSLRHPYHGRSELIASNSMAVIDATAVASRAHVYHWYEEREDVPPAAGLFWRQKYDVQTQSLSPLHTPCPPPCIQHHNPDIPLTTCSLPACKARMHKSCILDATSTRLQAKAEAEAEVEAEPETEIATSVSPRDKKGKKKVKFPCLQVDWRTDDAASAGIGEEGDGHYRPEDMHCLACGGSCSGW